MLPARLQSGAAVHITASAAPSVEQALKATIADKEQALQELRETNEVQTGAPSCSA